MPSEHASIMSGWQWAREDIVPPSILHRDPSLSRRSQSGSFIPSSWLTNVPLVGSVDALKALADLDQKFKNSARLYV